MAHVEVAHRFAPGTLVRLFAVRDHGHLQLRPEGQPLESAHVDADGVVRFVSELPAGGRYLVSGLLDGFPFSTQCRAVVDDAIVQPPVKPDRERQVRPVPHAPTVETDRLRQEDVPPGTPQASDTQTGVAAPLS
jgi:hypothetical protein